jgi:predicted RNA-binding Zn ribbon-like protein
MNTPLHPSFFFLGEQLSLDFVNTQKRGANGPQELLTSFDDLIDWLAQSRALEPDAAQAARKRWGGGRDAARVLTQARALRADLRAMAERLSQGKTILSATADAINAVLAVRRTSLRLALHRGVYRQQREMELDHPLQLLVPIAEAAAELVAHGDHSLVKKCGNPACILYFYDTTKNHRRLWCSMAVCGNRMKAAAHYRRTRQRKKMN